jgi:hypothetical protein
MMKKEYTNPSATVVVLKMTSSLLAGSDTINVSRDSYDEGNMTDL